MISDRCMAALESQWRSSIELFENTRKARSLDDLRELQLMYHVIIMLMPKSCDLLKEVSEKYVSIMNERDAKVSKDDQSTV